MRDMFDTVPLLETDCTHVRAYDILVETSMPSADFQNRTHDLISIHVQDKILVWTHHCNHFVSKFGTTLTVSQLYGFAGIFSQLHLEEGMAHI